MAAESGEKTEAPTSRRRQEARQAGQVARSADLAQAVVFLGGMIGLGLLGPALARDLFGITQACLGTAEPQAGDALALATEIATMLGKRLAPLLAAIMAAAAAVMIGQVGWLVTTRPLKPDLSRLNPIAGLTRLFSSRNAVALAMNLAKLALLLLVTLWTVWQRRHEIVFALTADPLTMIGFAVDQTFRLGINLALLLLVLAIIDYTYQRYRHERDLRMTKEEVREELRRMEGDPVIKRRRREVHRQLAFHQLKSVVPKADVIIANPTHLAIALQYEPDVMAAPKVLAKGADHAALRIRQIAHDAGVVIVERPSLARAMYDHVEPGKLIPERFYQAIAEILAYVYEITGRDIRRAAAAATA